MEKSASRRIDTDGYAIFKTAKELYGGERHIRLSELTDPDLIGEKPLRLIVNSFVVCDLLHFTRSAYCQWLRHPLYKSTHSW